MSSFRERALSAASRFAGVLSRLLRRSPLGTAFIEDRLLSITTAVLVVLIIALLFVTPILPFVDHGVNVGASGLLFRAATHEGVIGHYFKVNYALIPYWTTYVGTAIVSAVVGPLAAAKVLSAVCSIAVPLAIMRLLIALRRSPRLGLWAFVFAYDVNLHWGWASYLVGMALAFLALAWLLEAERLRDALRIVPLAVLISLSHVHAVAVFGLLASILILTREKPLRALGIHVVAMAGMSVVIVPWFWKSLRSTTPGAGFSAEFHSIAQRISSFHGNTLDTTTHPLGAKLTAWALVLFVVGLVMLAAAPAKDCPVRQRVQGPIVFVVFALLYILLPFQVNTPVYHTFTYTRLASFVLITALLVPCPDFTRWRALWLVPGVVSTLMVLRATEAEFNRFGKRVRPYLDIIAAMEPNTRFFPLDLEVNDPALRMPVFHMIHGYAAAAKQSYDPHLFDYPGNPLLYRHDRIPPVINWFSPKSFTTDDHGIYYDYIIVKGLKADYVRRGKSPKGPVVEHMLDAGDWRLYKVINPLPSGSKNAPPLPTSAR